MIVACAVKIDDQAVIIHGDISVLIFQKEWKTEYLFEFFFLSSVFIHNNISKRHIPAAFAVQLLQEFFDLFIRIIRIFSIAVYQLSHNIPVRIRTSLPKQIRPVLVSASVAVPHPQTYPLVHKQSSKLTVLILYIDAVPECACHRLLPLLDQTNDLFTISEQAVGLHDDFIKILRFPAPLVVQLLAIFGKRLILPGFPIIIREKKCILRRLHLSSVHLPACLVTLLHPQCVLHLSEYRLAVQHLASYTAA